jgi:hypothetical protein
MDVQYRVSDRLIVGYGNFPGGSGDPDLSIEAIDDDEVPKLAEPGAKYLEADNTIRVVPPPPPGPEFAAAEDVERLQLVNERAQTDPAFAALADLALRST